MTFELQQVGLRFRKATLFQNLNLRFEAPGIFAILGPSGCGKSTLLRILAGLQEVSEGKVKRPASQNQSFIFQEPQLLPWRTTSENVYLPLELQKTFSDQAAAHPKIESTLQAVGLREAAKLYPHELSGGMKMRASLARALVTDPEILFCDEPFAALDEITREDLQRQLRNHILKKQGLGFFVTHNLSEALDVADQIIIFKKQGEIDPAPYFVERTKNKENQLQELRQKVWENFK